MTETITICVNCKYHVNTHKGCRIGPPPETWFYQKCSHPHLERPLGIEPVSGEKMYMVKNDLGRTVFTEERMPDCRDINDGNCKYFEPLT